MQNLVEGKQVVILGGASGIGLAVASLSAEMGAKVTLLGRSPEKLHTARESIGHDADARVLDMLDEAAVNRVFRQLPSVDHLVLTAAADENANRAPFQQLDTARAQHSFSKFWGYFFVSRAAAGRIAKDGTITLFSGESAFKPPKEGMSVLSAVNGAVATFARALAAELAPVRVNAISPGIVNTGVWGEEQSKPRDEQRSWAETTLPTRRMGQPEDVAQAVLYLMTNPYTTGTVLHVDGGLSLI